MTTMPKALRYTPQLIISSACLLFIIFYSSILFFQTPYIGFMFDPATGRVEKLFQRPEGSDLLLVGDMLIRVNQVDFADTISNTRLSIYQEFGAGRATSLLVERDGRLVPLAWRIPGVNWGEALFRLQLSWLPVVFWLAGTAALFLLRPRDSRRILLAAFYFLTALWLVAGEASASRILHSAVLYRIFIWTCFPVYLHLQWSIPRPLGRLPRWLLLSGYAAAAILAAAEWFQLLPSGAYFSGFLIVLPASLVLFAARWIKAPAQRQNLRLLAIAVLACTLPAIPLHAIAAFESFPFRGMLSLLGLPLLPLAFFVSAYRRQLGDLELRANRIIIFYLYTCLLFFLLIGISSVTGYFLQSKNDLLMAGLLTSLAASLLSLYLFPHFSRWAERHVLGMKTAPARLLEEYTEKINAILDLDSLIRLIRDECLPALMIRQAALLRLDPAGKLIPIFLLQVAPQDLPEAGEIAILLADGGKLRPADTKPAVCPWARLVLPLNMNGQPGGVCLLGRRDPDDDYGPQEIPTLQALMNAVAIALLNIEQADRLRWLYQTDIERHEMERSRMALELHDGVLSQLAVLAMYMDEEQISPEAQAAYASSVAAIREIIKGLHPGSLNYGLWPALEDLADDSAALAADGTQIHLSLAPVPQEENENRRQPEVDLHLFRIVQQAVQNALIHSGARNITIRGYADGLQVSLEVCDDGKGFPEDYTLDLARLLAQKHFGLAGMHERAALIGARLEVVSKPGGGVTVRVSWSPDQNQG